MKLLEALRSFIRWQRRVFLRETRRTFTLTRNREEFVRTLKQRVTPAKKSIFAHPFGYKIRKGFFGYVDQDVVKISFVPRRLSLSALISPSPVRHYAGTFIKRSGADILDGEYRSTSFMAGFFLFYLNFCMFGVLISSVLLPVAIFADSLSALGGLASLAVSTLLVLLVYWIASLGRFLSRKERDEIFRLLEELA